MSVEKPVRRKRRVRAIELAPSYCYFVLFRGKGGREDLGRRSKLSGASVRLIDTLSAVAVSTERGKLSRWEDTYRVPLTVPHPSGPGKVRRDIGVITGILRDAGLKPEHGPWLSDISKRVAAPQGHTRKPGSHRDNRGHN